MKKFLLSLILSLASFYSYGANCHNISKNQPKIDLSIPVLNNIGYGVTEKSLDLMKNCPQKWINNQLNHPFLYDDSDVKAKNATLKLSQRSLLATYKNYDVYLNNDQTPNENGADGILYETFKKRMNYAIYSENRIREMMVWFWFNHFNVNANSNNISLAFLNDYEDSIRLHSLGNFKDLLKDTIKHPAMLHYLNNDDNRSPQSVINNKPLLRSIKDGDFLLEPAKYGYNENYARELLELHSLGVNGNYTQKDIENLSKILTGFTYFNFLEANKSVDLDSLRKIDSISQLRKFFPQYNIHDNFFIFDKNTHDYSTKQFMGTTIKGSGELEMDIVIDKLVNNAATAKFISTKMATYFLGKIPPDFIIQQMSQEFLKTKGDIAKTLYILLNSSLFWDNLESQGRYKDVYSSYVSLYKTFLNGQDIEDYSSLYNHLQSMEQGVYTRITPEGYSLLDSDYQSSQLMLNQINFTKFFIFYNKDATHKKLNLDYRFYKKLSPTIKDSQSLYLYFVSPNWMKK